MLWGMCGVRFDWSGREMRESVCLCVRADQKDGICVENERGQIGHDVVSRLTARLCGGLSPACVLSAPCCCGFCQRFMYVCVCARAHKSLCSSLCETGSDSSISGHQNTDRQLIRPHALLIDLWTSAPCLLGQHFAGSSQAMRSYLCFCQWARSATRSANIHC